MTSPILVTGGTDRLGRHVVRRLRDARWVPDLAGPQVTSWAGLLRGYLQASHRRRWVVPVPIPGTA